MALFILSKDIDNQILHERTFLGNDSSLILFRLVRNINLSLANFQLPLCRKIRLFIYWHDWKGCYA